MRLSRQAHSQRGSAILLVIIALSVLAIIGLAAVEFTGRDMGVSRAAQHRSALERCALAARNLMMAETRIGAPPYIASIQVSLDGDGGIDSVTFSPGTHYGVSDAGFPVSRSGSQGGVVNKVTDKTNKLFSGSANGSGGVTTLTCTDSDGRIYEAELAYQAF